MHNFFIHFFTLMKNLLIFILLAVLAQFSGITNYPLHIITNKTNLSITLFQITISFIISFLIIAVLYRYFNEQKISNLFHIKINVLMLLVLIIIGVAMESSSISGNLNLPLSDKIAAITGFRSLPIFMLYILVQCFLGPIIEELSFRGLLFDFIKNKTSSEMISLIVSSIVFALAHDLFSIKLIIYYFILGLVFGIARIKSRGIIAPIITHALSNAFLYVIAIVI